MREGEEPGRTQMNAGIASALPTVPSVTVRSAFGVSGVASKIAHLTSPAGDSKVSTVTVSVRSTMDNRKDVLANIAYRESIFNAVSVLRHMHQSAAHHGKACRVELEILSEYTHTSESPSASGA